MVHVRGYNKHDVFGVRTITVTVTDVNEPPVIYGGSNSLHLDEHSGTGVWSYHIVDPEDDEITLSLTGTDRDDFTIDNVGALSFSSMPNYEAPTDSNRDNVYHVTVRATANGQTSSEAVTVTVRDIPPSDEPIFITGPATASIAENATGNLVTLAASSDAAGPFTWSLSDYTHFSIDDGVISVTSPLDHETQSISYLYAYVENPHKSVSREITFTVEDVDEPPAISEGSSSIQVDEGSNLDVATYEATDPDSDTIVWSLSGADAGDFSISENGDLSFSSEPDYESPADSDENNVYEVTVRAGAGEKTSTLDVTVTVGDVNEAPVIAGPKSVSFDENSIAAIGTYTITDPENDQISISLSNTYDFTFTNGVLRFKSPPTMNRSNRTQTGQSRLRQSRLPGMVCPRPSTLKSSSQM